MTVSGPKWRLHALPRWAAAGLVVATPALTRWVIGPGERRPGHAFGPYSLPLGLERAAGFAALVITLAAVFGVVRSSRRRPARHEVTRSATLLIVAAGGIGAASWRVETAGVDGANIGGGLLLLTAPVIIAGLLLTAVRRERRARGSSLRYSGLLSLLAVLVAPMLFAVAAGLSDYDQSIGVISSTKFAAPQVADQHREVRSLLGRPGQVVVWFFPTQPAGSTCEYYSGVATTTYQLCYRNGILISKLTSDHPWAIH